MTSERTAPPRAGTAPVAAEIPAETPAETPVPAETRLLRIQEAAAEVGLTPRSVRYYEELGLVTPAARSEGDYRLYDETDVERLKFIKGLRDDAGFSLAEIAQLLEDEAARERGHAAYHATTDPAMRLQILRDRAARYMHQMQMLRTKISRLESMVDETEARLGRTNAKIEALAAEIEGPGASSQMEPAR
jgi:MerR family transcriptional regulator, repressor of the yfmOP operon